MSKPVRYITRYAPHSFDKNHSPGAAKIFVKFIYQRLLIERQMKDREELKNELTALGANGGKFTHRPEVKELPEILDRDEHVLALTRGSYDDRTWIMVATDKRILFMDKVMFVGIKELEIRLDILKETQFEKNILSFVRKDGGKCIVKSVDKSTGQGFSDAINDFLTNGGKPEAAAAVVPPPPPPAVAIVESRQFEYQCPHCKAVLGVDNAWINLQLECPECHREIQPRPTLKTIAPPPGAAPDPAAAEKPADEEIKPAAGYKFSNSIFAWWFWLLLALMMVFVIVGTSKWGKNFSCRNKAQDLPKVQEKP